MENLLYKISTISTTKKVVILGVILLLFCTVLFFFIKGSGGSQETIYNTNKGTFTTVNEIGEPQRLDNIKDFDHGTIKKQDSKELLSEEIQEIKSDKQTTITKTEGTEINIGKEDITEGISEKNITSGIVKDESSKKTEKELQDNQSVIVNTDDQEIKKKEVQIKTLTINELKKKYSEMLKKIQNGFKGLSSQEQDKIVEGFNKLIGGNIQIKRKEYLKKIAGILKYLKKENEYTMLEKILSLSEKEIIKGTFINTLKTDRMLFNDTLIEVL